VTEEVSWYSELAPTAASEAAVIVRKFRERGIDIGGVTDPADHDRDVTPGGIAYMYAQDHFLAREQYLGGVGQIQGAEFFQSAARFRGVLDVLEQHGVARVEITRVIDDIVLVRAVEGDRRDTLFILDRVDEEFGPGIATPDHVLTAANGELSPCAASEPQEVYLPAEPHPAPCRGDGGARVRIFIADTGLLPGAEETFPWLRHATGDPDPRLGPDNTILPYAGHGTFVAGVLGCLAPDAEIRVANIFDTAGSALESEFVPRLNAAFGFGCEILHLTASCTTRNNSQLIALDAWLELFRQYKGVICVAPAGNNHTRRPSFPAASPHVISVGALAADGHSRAYFSNYGGWVDVYAPGQNLINAFAAGVYICQISPYGGETRTFQPYSPEGSQECGLAQWSGTSFSAPIVTGLIAARMARRGESAREAATALLARAGAQAIRGVGPVLLPGCGDDDDER
jgi:Subtilase family